MKEQRQSGDAMAAELPVTSQAIRVAPPRYGPGFVFARIHQLREYRDLSSQPEERHNTGRNILLLVAGSVLRLHLYRGCTVYVRAVDF